MCCSPSTYLCYGCAVKEQQEGKRECTGCGAVKVDKGSIEFLQMIEKRMEEGNVWVRYYLIRCVVLLLFNFYTNCNILIIVKKMSKKVLAKIFLISVKNY